MNRPTKLLMPHNTGRLARPKTASHDDMPRFTQQQSQRIVSLLLVAIDTVEGIAHECTTLAEQRELVMKEVRILATTLKRCGALIETIIWQRIKELPVRKP